VRRYRYVLRTTDPAVLERLHADTLKRLDPLVRANILLTAQRRLLSGRDLTVDDVARIARLVTAGEHRTPGILVSALAEAALLRLATAVNRAAEARGLLAGYATWNGSDESASEHATDVARREGAAEADLRRGA
jgi:hypothetical protein